MDNTTLKEEQKETFWITEEYLEYYENIKKYIKMISREMGGIQYFTSHDSNHCYSVEKIVKDLVKKSGVELNELERFILLCAVWTHDLGMFDDFAKEHLGDVSIDVKRERHDETSAWFLKKNFIEIFGLGGTAGTPEDKERQSNVESYVNTVNIISKFHRKKVDIAECPNERFVENRKIRTRLLACFLRLGDTLHLDLSRFDKKLYDLLQIGNFDRNSRLHWLKSYVVSNIHVDEKKGMIFINLDLPEYRPIDNGEQKQTYTIGKNELEEGYERLASIIREVIFEDVLEVNETFRDNNLTCYAGVKSIISLIPGYDERDYEEILSIIRDIEIILSPSDSKVNKKTINSIISLCKIKFPNYENFYNYTEQLIAHLEKISDDRPCHVGLKKIITRMKRIFNKEFKKKYFTKANIREINRLQKLIYQAVNNINEKREKWENKVYDKCEEHLNGIKYVFLCGVSEMVQNFLDEYARRDNGKNFKDDVRLYVLEFGGKRRFSHNNLIDYNDGIFYSLQLRKRGYKNVYLMPDTSLASCINDLKTNEKMSKRNSVVLFGANGIDKDGNCGHSSGHLMVTIVANHFNIPVKVISNRFKQGRIEWNLSKKRDSLWLTCQKSVLNELKGNNIERINYLEDKIPKKDIDIISN